MLTQTWPGALGLFILVVGSIAGLTYYGIQKHNDVQTAVVSSEAAQEATYTSGEQIDDGGAADTTTDISITNPKTYESRGTCSISTVALLSGGDVSFYQPGCANRASMDAQVASSLTL